MYDTPGSNNHASQAQRRKPPIHKNNRRNMDLYNPSGVQQNDPQNMLPHISSTGELVSSHQGGSVPSGSRHQYGGHGRGGQNMAYVNISQEGNKPVGPIGLKRAEKELIMRRYKNAYHQNDNVNRVALIYGQQHPLYNSNDRQYLNDGGGGLGLGNRGSGGGGGYYI